eukprot:scaffold7057_cov20-Tisochrysis_lutea.AAC.1
MCPVQDGHTKYPVDSDCNFNASQFKRSACTFLLHFLQTRPAQGPLSGPLQDAMQALQKGFFGPPKSGVYSPAVQYTVYDMGSHVLDAVPE